MKIKKIELIELKIPFKEPYEISSGTLSDKYCILTKLYTDDFVGIGQAAPMPAPFYSSETPTTCFHIIKDFIIPRLLNRDVINIEDVDDIFLDIRGNNFAKAGIETALWDLLAKSNSKPLYEFIGGENKEIKWKISFGIKRSIESLLDSVEKFLDNGCRSVKLKIKKGWDIEPVRRVREKFGDIELMVDANSHYTLDDIEIFKELDKYNLTQIEQPLHYEDIYDHHRLLTKIDTPICLDESISSVSACKNALNFDCCNIINIKVQRVGGIKNAILIHNICKEKNIPVWIGSMRESGVGNIVNLALCSLPNVLHASNIDPPGSYLKEDITIPDIVINENNNMKLPNGKGLGVDLNPDMINKLKVNSYMFK